MKSIIITNNTNSILSFPGFNISHRDSYSLELNEIQFEEILLTVISNYVEEGKASCYLDSQQLSADDVESLKYRDVVSDGSIGKDTTIEDLDIYVNPTTGDNYSGDGSADSPYATITYAFSRVPKKIEHKVNVLIAAGTYSEFPYDLTHEIHKGGQLTIQGQGDPTVIYGPYTTTSWTNIVADGTTVAHNINVAGASWTTDQFVGYFLRPTSGANSGRYYSIQSNDADKITLGLTSMPLAPTDTFEIVDLPVKLELNHGVDFHVETRGDESFPSFYGLSFGVTGIYFKIDGSTYYGFKFSGNQNNSYFNAVKFNSVWNAVEGTATINIGNLIYPNEIKNTDMRVTNMIYVNYITSTIFTETDLAPGSWKRSFEVSRGSCEIDYVSVIGGFCALNGSYLNVYHCTASGLESYNSNVDLSESYFGRCFDDVIYVKSTSLHCQNIFIQDAVKSAFYAIRSKCRFSDIGGIAANITKYGMHIGVISSVQIRDTTLGGLLGDIHWDISGTTVAYPAAGLSVTDSAGSFVVNK